MLNTSPELNEILRNIILTPDDIRDGKLTDEFYRRIDISDIKKEKIKELLEKKITHD